MTQPRKVAMLGGVAQTLRYAPWDDARWAIWAHNSLPVKRVRRVDRWFDLHPPHCYRETVKCGRRYHDWLKGLTVPVYMQAKDPEIPASVRYPRERIQAEWSGIPFGSQTAWMIALALTEGYDTIGLFGIHYQHQSEYAEQRANAELWVGIALGSGVKVVVPDECPLMHEPRELYGYESHSTPEKYAARKARSAAIKAAMKSDTPRVMTVAPGFDPSRLVRCAELTPPPEVAAKWAASEQEQHEKECLVG